MEKRKKNMSAPYVKQIKWTKHEVFYTEKRGWMAEEEEEMTSSDMH